MSAQSFHAQVSNAMTVAVNHENERSLIGNSAAFDGGQVAWKRERSTPLRASQSRKASPSNSLLLKAVLSLPGAGVGVHNRSHPKKIKQLAIMVKTAGLF